MALCISSHNFHGGVGRNIGQKTFVSTCYFQPKRVPVRYTETMILNVNSAKRRYFESVAYETKMVPSQWSQTMYVDVFPGRDRFVSEVLVPCEIYVPLIAQEGGPETINQVQQSEKLQKCTNDKQETESCAITPKKEKTTKILLETPKHPKNSCEEFLNEMRRMY